MINSKIIITIDTEVGETSKNFDNGFEKLVIGKIENEYYGVFKIMDISEKYGFKCEFFIDVYEYKKFGEENFKKVCKDIDNRNHGVQLHTHPSYAYDKNRINMYEYSLEEQIKIIKEGKELIKKWIGKYPISHRAGNYGANDDTLLALRENGILIDSSFFYKHPNSKINAPTINIPILYKDILQFPVTVIKKFSKRKGIPIPIKYNYVKLDVNGMDKNQILDSIKKLNGKVEYIILFLHSCSFIKTDHTKLDKFEIDYKAIESFENALQFCKKENITSILFKDIIKC
jgi:hypothetical protein